MRTALAIGMIAAMTATAGCSQGRAQDAGPNIQQKFAVGGFQRIDVGGPYEVTVRTGAAPSVSASGPQRMIEDMVVEVKGDSLQIHPKEHHGFNFGGWRSDSAVRVQVTTQQLIAASLGGSGSIRVDRVGGNSFEGAIGGSGAISVDRLEVQSASMSIGGSGNIRAGSGRIGQADYSVAGSGGIDTRGLSAETAKVSITGSGSVDAQATRTAQINIVGSGDAILTGGAKCSVSKMGSGSARCS